MTNVAELFVRDLELSVLIFQSLGDGSLRWPSELLIIAFVIIPNLLHVSVTELKNRLFPPFFFFLNFKLCFKQMQSIKYREL